MSIEKLRSKFFTGAFITDVKHYFTKINEIIDWVNNIGTPSYKVYTALLTQSALDAPTAIVLNNTLGGTPIWSRTNNGKYLLTLSGVFTLGKTIVIPPSNPNDPDSASVVNLYSCGSDDVNTIYLFTSTISETTAIIQTNDNLLYGAGYSSIEIRVYN